MEKLQEKEHAMDITTVFFFLAIIVGTLAITYSAAKRTSTPHDFYAAGNRLTGMQNGLAIAGDYMSAASFLGITGAIGIYGFDGFFYSLGFLVSYLVILFMVAEPLHNLGKYTLADSIIQRFDSKRLRGVIAMTNILITIFYMIAQLVGAGALIHLLLDVDYRSAVFIVGSLMTTFVLFGGMIAASWVQIIKAILLLSGTLIVCLIVLSRFDWSLVAMFDHVTNATPYGINILYPGNQFENPFDTISLHLALILGTAGLPHILVRFFTVRDAIETRRSVMNATWMIGAFYLMTFVLGFGAISFVGWDAIRAAEFGGNLTVPMLARALGGEFLMAYISAVAFATILAVVTGLVMSASSAFAHDFYSHIVRGGSASESEQFFGRQMLSRRCRSHIHLDCHRRSKDERGDFGRPHVCSGSVGQSSTDFVHAILAAIYGRGCDLRRDLRPAFFIVSRDCQSECDGSGAWADPDGTVVSANQSRHCEHSTRFSRCGDRHVLLTPTTRRKTFRWGAASGSYGNSLAGA
ncbi:UNVERIFIED_CONTAM: cation/acetate symporter [Brevibacillus sp. OAP136]